MAIRTLSSSSSPGEQGTLCDQGIVCDAGASEQLAALLPFMETEEGTELPGTFESWLNRPLVSGTDPRNWYVGGPLEWFDDFDFGSTWNKATLRDLMNNDLCLYDARPVDFLNLDDAEMHCLYEFSPEYLDWGHLRAVPREEWHHIVRSYYELLYEREFWPDGLGYSSLRLVTHRRKGIQSKLKAICEEWCPHPNPLFDIRRRLFPYM